MELKRRSLAFALGAGALAVHEFANAQPPAGGSAAAPPAAMPRGPGQVPFPQQVADVQLPAMGIVMHPEYARSIARMAYIWGWPLVNMLNRKIADRKSVV